MFFTVYATKGKGRQGGRSGMIQYSHATCLYLPSCRESLQPVCPLYSFSQNNILTPVLWITYGSYTQFEPVGNYQYIDCKSSLHDLHLKGMWLIKNLGTHRLLCNALPFLTTTTYSQSSSGAYHAGVPWAATANSTPIWLKLSRKIIWVKLHLPKPDIGNHKAGRRF